MFHSPTLNRACIIPNLFPPSSWSLKERPIRMSAPTCEPQRSSPFPPRFFFPLITRKNSSTPVTCYKFSLSDHVHPIAFRHGSRWIGTDFLGFCFFFLAYDRQLSTWEMDGGRNLDVRLNYYNFQVKLFGNWKSCTDRPDLMGYIVRVAHRKPKNLIKM